jgi:hypothetical protein
MVQQRRKVQRTRAITIFIGLAVVYAVLAIVANVVFSGNTLVQTLLLSLGSAVLGSGIAFFLTKVYGLEPTRNDLPSIVRTFMALTVVFVALALVALLHFPTHDGCSHLRRRINLVVSKTSLTSTLFNQARTYFLACLVLFTPAQKELLFISRTLLL